MIYIEEIEFPDYIKLCTQCKIPKYKALFGSKGNGDLKEQCKKCVNANTFWYRQKPKVKAKREIEYTKSNAKPEVKERKKKYYASNAVRTKSRGGSSLYRTRISAHARNRRKTDILFRLKCILRSRLRNAIKSKNKIGSAIGCLGCTTAELKTYIESKFCASSITGEIMTWENHGYGPNKWQIDHIRELRHFNLQDPKQFLLVNHFSNLQPLWHEDHIIKTKLNNKGENYEIFSDQTEFISSRTGN